MLPGAVWQGIPRDENGNGLSCKELLSKSRIDLETDLVRSVSFNH